MNLQAPSLPPGPITYKIGQFRDRRNLQDWRPRRLASGPRSRDVGQTSIRASVTWPRDDGTVGRKETTMRFRIALILAALASNFVAALGSVGAQDQQAL